MSTDILFEVIGNTSPFSMMGESSGYMVSVNDHSYLLDCGSPVFPHLGYEGIAEIMINFISVSRSDALPGASTLVVSDLSVSAVVWIRKQ